MSGSAISLWHLWGLGSIVLSLSSIVYYWHLTITRIPSSIAWVGVRDEAFSKPRAWVRELFAGLSTLHEGYVTHNKKGKPFVLLDTAGRPNIILPKELCRWMVTQPDDILSSRKLLHTKFAVEYLVPYFRHELDIGMNLAIRRDLTRNLGRTQKVSFNTIRHRADKLMGTDTHSWHEINLTDVIGAVILDVSYRMLFGDALFHNKAFMKTLDSFGIVYGLASLLIGQFAPFFVRPFVGNVAAVAVRFYRMKALKFLVPAARERITALKSQKEDPGFEYEAPMDFMHWIMTTCPDARAEEIAALVLTLVLGATHTSVMISTATIVDLLSSPPELGYYEAIREEAASVFRTEEDFGNLALLHKLSRIDSSLKETMRRNPLAGRGIMHEVVHPNGVTLPDGQNIPQGAWLGIPMTEIGHDERYYPNPHTYDPFRFSRARMEIALRKENNKNTFIDSATTTTKAAASQKNGVDTDCSTEPAIGKVDSTTDQNKLNGSWLSTTGDDFGAFGFGRHSCPGRWFASHIMKMTLAYVALSYEIQPINDRPPNIIIGDVIVPPRNVMIKVRRRKLSV